MRRTALLSLAIGVGLVSSVAWAGDLRCQVSDKAGPQANVKVTVTPGGTTLATARDGTCVFRGLPEGTYRVAAEKTAGGELRGAVAEDVRVRASGQTDVKLQLVRAIHIHEYTPLRHGTTWTYKHRAYEWKEDAWGGWWDPRGNRGLYDSMKATVAGTARFAGAEVTKVEWAGMGFLGGGYDLLYTTYETSSPEGYAIHGRTRERGDKPGYRYDPPLLIPVLLPLGHACRLTTTIRYTDGTPSKRVARIYTLTGFERRWLDAETRDECARVVWTEEPDDTTRAGGFVVVAKGIGTVAMSFSDGHILEDFWSLRYQPPPPPAPSAARTLPRAVKPSPPSPPAKAPSKSLPSK